MEPGRESLLTPAPVQSVHSAVIFQSPGLLHKLFPWSATLWLQTSAGPVPHSSHLSLKAACVGCATIVVPLPGHLRSLGPEPRFSSLRRTYLHMEA